MAKTRFDDVDRLIIEDWDDVDALIEAVDGLRRKIREVFEEASPRIVDAVRRAGYECQVFSNQGEVWGYRAHWAKREDPKLTLVVGGFDGKTILEQNDSKPYVEVYGPGLKSLGLDKTGRESFRTELKRALGPEAHDWDEDTDEEVLLSQYILKGEEQKLRQLILDEDKLAEFVAGQLTRMNPIADHVDRALKTVLSAGIGGAAV